MNVNFCVNNYILIWNLLFQASISEPIYNLKQTLWTNYKDEYNNTYRDKNLILKDTKNFIPNDDTIYNIVFKTKEYEKLERKADKYRLELMQLWDSNKKMLNVFIKSILKREIKPYTILVVNEELDIIDVNYQNKDSGIIIVGKKIDKKDPLRIIIDIVMAIVKEEIRFTTEKSEIGTAIIELAVLNELATILMKKSCYLSGQPSLSSIKRNIYPYWLMYLSVPKDEFTTYMTRDKIAFDANSMAYEKELRKMDISEFIDFCYRNRRYIVKIEKLEII